MWISRTLPTVLAIASLTGVAAIAVYAQSAATPPTDPVVAEIRALRVDLNERLEATMRAQLLVARLQVQEQRVNTVLRQIQDVDAKLRENATSKEKMENGLKMFGGLDKDDKDPASNEGADFFLGPIKSGLEKAGKIEADLKMQQMQLTGMLAEEQARWSAFNARLDDLERLFAKPPAKR